MPDAGKKRTSCDTKNTGEARENLHKEQAGGGEKLRGNPACERDVQRTCMLWETLESSTDIQQHGQKTAKTRGADAVWGAHECRVNPCRTTAEVALITYT